MGAEPEPEQMVKQSSSGTVLDSFWNLAESDASTRHAATKALLETPSVLEKGSSDNVYTIKRLVRGLTSSRGFARQGFSVTLTQLLRVSEELEVKSVLDQILASTQVLKSFNGLETRGCFLGRLFGFLALIRSGRCDTQCLVKIVENALVVSKKKAWIEDLAIETICEALRFAASLEDKDCLRELISSNRTFGFDKLGWKEMTAAQLSLVATLDLITRDNKKARKSLKTATVGPLLFPSAKEDVSEEVMQQLMAPLALAAHASPQMHLVWPKALRLVLQEGMDAFKTFWNVLLKEFVSQGSHEKKYTMMLVLDQAVQLFVEQGKQADIVDVLLQQPLTNVIWFFSKKKFTYLHKMAIATQKKLMQTLAVDSVSLETRVLVGTKLGVRASLVSKEISDKNDADNSKDNSKSNKFISAEVALAQITEQQEKAQESLNLAWLTPMYQTSRRLENLDEKYTVCLDLAKFFLREGLLTSTDQSLTPSQKGKREAFSEKSQSLFHHVMHDLQVVERSKYLYILRKESANSADEREQLELSFLTMSSSDSKENSVTCGYAIRELNTMMDEFVESPEFTLTTKLSEQEQESRAAALRLSKSIQSAINGGSGDDETSRTRSQKKKTKKKTVQLGADQQKVASVLVFLLEHLALQVVLLADKEDLGVDILEVLEDLVQCATDVAASGYDLKSASKRAAESDEESPNPMAVLTDILLALLAQDSSLIREFTSFAFRLLSPFVDVDSLSTVFDALLASHTMDIQDQTSEEDADSEEEEDNEEENQEEEDMAESDAESSKDSDEDSESKENNSDDNESVDIDLDPSALAKALKAATPMFEDKEEEEGDEENGSGNVDDALASFVRAQMELRESKKPKARQKLEIQKINFKTRVSDLVEVFVSAQPHSALASLVPIALCRAATLCFISSGSLKKGSAGEVSFSLFKRLHMIAESLARKWSKKNPEFDWDASFELDPESACFEALDLSEADLTAGAVETVKIKANSVTPRLVLERSFDVLVSLTRRSVNVEMNKMTTTLVDLLYQTLSKVEDSAQMDTIIGKPLTAAVEDYVTRRKTRLEKSFFQRFLQKEGYIVDALVKAFAQFAKNPSRFGIRMEVLDHLALGLKRTKQAQVLQDSASGVCACITSFFEAVASGEDPKLRKAQPMRSALKVLKDLFRSYEKLAGKQLDASTFNDLREVLTKILLIQEGFVSGNVKAEIAQVLTTLLGVKHLPDYKVDKAEKKQKKRQRQLEAANGDTHADDQASATKKRRKEKGMDFSDMVESDASEDEAADQKKKAKRVREEKDKSKEKASSSEKKQKKDKKAKKSRQK